MMTSPLDVLDSGWCSCEMPACVCLPAERVLRKVRASSDEIILTAEQRAWCLDEIAKVEGYSREDYEGVPSDDLARGVLEAWTDYCRDKGLI